MTDLVKEPAAIKHSSAERRPLYLAVKPDPIFAVLHVPDAAASGHLGVVFCPPFGWDELCTHRSMRSWADAVAADGRQCRFAARPGAGGELEWRDRRRGGLAAERPGLRTRRRRRHRAWGDARIQGDGGRCRDR
jgi:hypothetical protein